MLQGKLPSNWVVTNENGSDSEELFDPESEIRNSEVNSMWTRVKSVGTMKMLTVQLYDLDKDITGDQALAKARKHISTEKGSCLFDPQSFDSKAQNYQLNRHALPDNELQAFGEMAT